MNITIREATILDAETISQLSKDALGYEYPPEKTAQKLDLILNSKRNKVYVAVVDALVVGYIHANTYDVLYFPTMANILGLAVDCKYRRNGVGTALIEAVGKWAKSIGASAIRLNSGSSRKEAHNFYRNCGFSSEKQQFRFIKPL